MGESHGALNVDVLVYKRKKAEERERSSPTCNLRTVQSNVVSSVYGLREYERDAINQRQRCLVVLLQAMLSTS